MQPVLHFKISKRYSKISQRGRGHWTVITQSFIIKISYVSMFKHFNQLFKSTTWVIVFGIIVDVPQRIVSYVILSLKILKFSIFSYFEFRRYFFPQRIHQNGNFDDRDTGIVIWKMNMPLSNICVVIILI